MKYNFLIFFILLSCVPLKNDNILKKTYSGSGFAYVYNEQDYKDKIINKKFDNNIAEIGHHKLKVGTIVKIHNPVNKKHVTLEIKKKVSYPEFFQLLITEETAVKLNLDKSSPFVEIQELKKNDSFIAKRAETFSEEKSVHLNAPVTNIVINNISKQKKEKEIKAHVNIFNIIVADFYSYESAESLKFLLLKKLSNLNNKRFAIKKGGANSFKLILGPYNAINSLKNDYIDLKNYGFEELEIKLN